MKKITFLLFLVPLMAISQIPSYYNDVNLSLSGTNLKDELAIKITSTHVKFLSYSEVWDASKITDLDPNDGTQSNVILVYGYNNNDGNYITDRTRSKDLNGGTSGTDWNREHTYPKSLGNPNLGTSGPGSDAHHLRPADVTFNGNRGSKKFASGSGNAGDSNGGWYPGDEWKGDIARMMMYMYLRYGSQCLPTAVGNGSSSNTLDDMIDLFLQWNAEDPVSQLEINRNEYHGLTANAFAQGNRNPFIDNPAFATIIWGGPQAEDRFDTGNNSDTQSPTTPSNLIATNTTETQTTLNWSPASDNIGVTGYDIYRNESLYDSTIETTYNATGLTENTTYTFKVRAKDVAGNLSNDSNSISVTTLSVTSGGNADELFFSEYVEGSSNNKALEIANFTGASINLSGYSLKRNTNGGSSWGSAYNLSGQIVNGDVFVIANSSSTNTILNIADITSSSDALLFNGNDPVGLFKNNVLIDIIGNFASGSANFAKDVTLIRKSTVSAPNTSYATSEWDTFSIDTFSDLGNHTFNGGENQDTEAPSTPTGLSATNIAETNVSLSWDAATDNIAVTEYEVFQDGNFLASTVSTSYLATGLSVVNSYNFSIKAKDAAGNLSDSSNSINVTTVDQTAPSVPTGIESSNTTQTTTDLSWVESSDNVAVTSYDIYQNGALIASTTNTSYSVLGLTAETTYTFAISAKDAAGNNSINSNTYQVTTQNDTLISTTLLDTSFETGWEGWSDGGSDCYRIRSSRSYDGSYSIRIRDNSGTASSMTSSTYNVSSYTNLEVSFYFYSYSMENGEDFWLQYHDGNSWKTIETYASGTDFNNSAFYTATVNILNSSYNFPSNARFRFRCDASSNADQIYIDKVTVIASTSSAAKSDKENVITKLTEFDTSDGNSYEIDEMTFYPNPTKGYTTLHTEIDLEDTSTDVIIKVLNLQGKILKTLKINNVNSEYLENKLDLSALKNGVYFINISSSKGMNETKKLIIK